MAEFAGTMISAILLRVRDPQGLAHSRTTVLSLLSQAQRIINAATDLVYETVTVTTEPKRQLYSLGTLAPNSVSLRDVKEGGRSLTRVDPLALFYTNREWARQSGSRYEAFGEYGLEFAVIHPATDDARSIDLTYTKVTTDMTVAPVGTPDPEANTTDLPDDILPALMHLTEALLQLRGRKIAEALGAVGRFTGTIQAYQRHAKV